MRAILALLFAALPATAQEAPQLTFPVDCTLDETCMIQQLMDQDPTAAAQDFLCGPMSYDGHRGTDIRVPDMEALAQGVEILAAAPGTVLGIRNSVPDTGQGGYPTGQECGNGVVIEHADGWQTQYCHLAQGSILVRTGDAVQSGQPIGEMGFSGNTEFPHLHMSVRQNGVDVDPFDPSGDPTCGADSDPLWADDVPLSIGGILSLGFSDAIPEFDAIRAGTADAASLSRDTDALVLWGFFHGGQVGDLVTVQITAPDGTSFHTQDIELERTQAQLFRATGRRNSSGLRAGDYTGTVTLTRDGVVIDTETTVISIN